MDNISDTTIIVTVLLITAVLGTILMAVDLLLNMRAIDREFDTLDGVGRIRAMAPHYYDAVARLRLAHGTNDATVPYCEECGTKTPCDVMIAIKEYDERGVDIVYLDRELRTVRRYLVACAVACALCLAFAILFTIHQSNERYMDGYQDAIISTR